MEELSQVSDSLHALRHDLLNHLYIASDLMQKGTLDEGKQHLQNIESHILQIFSTGCPALDSALYLKQQEMMHRNIIFQPNIEPLKSLPITTYDLCTIVSNLLDNAIDAADRFPEMPKDYTIKLGIYRSNNMLFVECQNPVWEPSLQMDGEHFVTSKSGKNHGLGIRTIEQILDRLDAQRTFSAENGQFLALMVLPYFGEIDVTLPHDEAVKKSEEAIRKLRQERTWLTRIKRKIQQWRNR